MLVAEQILLEAPDFLGRGDKIEIKLSRHLVWIL